MLREGTTFAATSTSRPSRRIARADAARGRYADRLSINIELPTAESLTALAPEKTAPPSTDPWPAWRCNIGESRARAKEQAAQAIVSMPQSRTTRRASAPLFAPGGQSTQMIVGPMPRTTAPSSPPAHGCTACTGCGGCTTRPSAPSPTPRAPCRCPPPHGARAPAVPGRLADALYGFTHDEIVPPLRWACWRWTWTLLAWRWRTASVFR